MNNVKYVLKEISGQKSNTLSIKFHLHNTGWQSISISQYLSVCLEQNAKWDQRKSPIKRIPPCFQPKASTLKKMSTMLCSQPGKGCLLLFIHITPSSKATPNVQKWIRPKVLWILCLRLPTMSVQLPSSSSNVKISLRG